MTSAVTPRPPVTPTTEEDQIGTPLTKYLYRVTEAMKLLSMSRTVIYEEMRGGRLHFVKRGRSTLIPAESIANYVQLLINESGGSYGQAA